MIKMKKGLKVFFIAFSVIILLAVGAAGYFLSNLDANKYKDDIAKIAKDATGRNLFIDGDIEIKIFSLNPKIVINNIRFANADFARNVDMVKAERIEAAVAVLPLFSKKIEVANFALIKPEIYLETDKQGNVGWDIAPKKEEQAIDSEITKEAEIAEEVLKEEEKFKALDVDIKKLLIKNGVFVYVDGEKNQEYSLAINQFELKTNSSEMPLSLDFEIVFDNKKLNGTGEIGRISDLLAGGKTPYPFDLKFLAGGLELDLKGDIVEPLKNAEFNVEVTSAVKEVKDFADFMGMELPKLGSLNGFVKISGSKEPLEARLEDLNFDFKALTDLSLNVKGKLDDIINLKGVDIKVLAQSGNIGSFLKPFSEDLSKIGKLDFSAQATDKSSRINIEKFKVIVGESDLEGKIVLAKDFKTITADFNSKKVNLSEFMPAKQPEMVLKKDEGEGNDVEVKNVERVIPDIKIPYELLNERNLNLTYNLNELVLPENKKLSKLGLDFKVNNGNLRLNRLKADVGEGSFNVTLGLNASSGRTGVFSLKSSGRNILIPDIYGGSDSFRISEGGKTDFDINLSGNGKDLRAILANLDGQILVALDQTRMSSSFLDWFTKDITSEILGLLGSASTKDALKTKCSVIRLDIDKGIAKTDKGIVLEGDKVNFVISGTIGLGNESLDISFMPQAKQGVRIGVAQAFSSLIRIRGSFANPKTGIDAKNTAKTALSVGAAIATGGLSAVGQMVKGVVVEDADLCYNALSGTSFADKFKASKPAASSKEDNNKGNSLQDMSPKEFIEDLTKGLGGLLKKLK